MALTIGPKLWYNSYMFNRGRKTRVRDKGSKTSPSPQLLHDMRENLNPPLQLTGELNDWTTIFYRIHTRINGGNLCLCDNSSVRRDQTKEENSIDLGERFLE
jgi:hypothetical protein